MCMMLLLLLQRSLVNGGCVVIGCVVGGTVALLEPFPDLTADVPPWLVGGTLTLLEPFPELAVDVPPV